MSTENESNATAASTQNNEPLGVDRVVSQLQPTIIGVDEELLRKTLDVCETAIENTSEVLANHDASLGRTTRKNKWIADRHEAEIAAAKSCRDLLRVVMGWKPIG